MYISDEVVRSFNTCSEGQVHRAKRQIERSAQQQDTDHRVTNIHRFRKELREMEDLEAQAKEAILGCTEQGWQEDHPGRPFELRELLRMQNPHTIERICRIVGCDYDPNRAITLGDLARVSLEKAKFILSDITDADVTTHGHVFLLQDRGQYAPQKFSIGLDYDTQLLYNDCGLLTDPIVNCPALFLGARLGFDFNANVRIARGEFAFMKQEGTCEPKRVFRVGPIAEASTHLLIVAEWGGSSSKTRGHSEAKIKSQDSLEITHFERISSKKGGEGVDYYIVPCQQHGVDINSLINLTAAQYHAAMVEDMAVYYEKSQLIKKLDVGIENFKLALNVYAAKMQKLRTECAEFMQSLEQSYFITPPELPTEVIDDNIDFDAFRYLGIEEIEELLADNPVAELQREIEGAETAVLNWELFVPRYLPVHRIVTKLGGNFSITGDRAKLSFPAPNFQDQSFFFSEGSLYTCTALIETYCNDESGYRSKNDVWLAKYGAKKQ